MAILGTFSSFTAARLGIYASQAQLQITGNNIANINTRGYTRQRADLFSLNATGLAKYATGLGPNVGYGVLVDSVSQLRDPFLDIRFRNQNTKTAEAEATLAGLRKIAQTLDEVNKGDIDGNGVIEKALKEMLTMLRLLSDDVGSEEYDSLVREAAKSLTTFFNTAADKLERDWDLQKGELEDTVKSVNKCLTNIRDLNEQIRKQGIYGDNALELRDQRNLYIDELSSYLGIDVEYSMERIDQYTEVEKLTIYLKDTQDPREGPGHRIKLVDGIYAAQLSFSYEEEINPQYNAAQPQTAQLNNGNPPKLDEEGNPYLYLDENGEGTNDITKANMVLLNPRYEDYPRALNPNYEEGSDDPLKAKYLDEKGQPTNNKDLAARVRMNPAYTDSKWGPLPNPAYPDPDDDSVLPYLTAEGKPTDVLTEAAYVLIVENPDYDPENPTVPQYLYLDAEENPVDTSSLSEDAPLEAVVQPYLDREGNPTANFADAVVGKYLDKDGNDVTDMADAAAASRKYIAEKPDKDGNMTTNDPALAAKVEEDPENPKKFLLQLERLENKFGVPMNRGKYGDEKESVAIPLNDTELQGAIQAMRELLTEEGEFASWKDVGIDADMSYSDIRASDPRASLKKGIPYYQRRLDLLAQQFAKIFNENNQMSASRVYESVGKYQSDSLWYETGTVSCATERTSVEKRYSFATGKLPGSYVLGSPHTCFLKSKDNAYPNSVGYNPNLPQKDADPANHIKGIITRDSKGNIVDIEFTDGPGSDWIHDYHLEEAKRQAEASGNYDVYNKFLDLLSTYGRATTAEGEGCFLAKGTTNEFLAVKIVNGVVTKVTPNADGSIPAGSYFLTEAEVSRAANVDYALYKKYLTFLTDNGEVNEEQVGEYGYVEDIEKEVFLRQGGEGDDKYIKKTDGTLLTRDDLEEMKAAGSAEYQYYLNLLTTEGKKTEDTGESSVVLYEDCFMHDTGLKDDKGNPVLEPIMNGDRPLTRADVEADPSQYLELLQQQGAKSEGNGGFCIAEDIYLSKYGTEDDPKYILKDNGMPLTRADLEEARANDPDQYVHYLSLLREEGAEIDNGGPRFFWNKDNGMYIAVRIDEKGNVVEDYENGTDLTTAMVDDAEKNNPKLYAQYLEILREHGLLKEEYNYYDGGVLFSNSGDNNDPTHITAKNISIAHDWSARIVRILNTTEPNEVGNDGKVIERSSANDNIMHLIAMFEKQLDYRAADLEGYEDAAGGDKPFFHGSFQEMYTDLGATLGMEQNTMDGIAYNYEVMTLDLDNDRISVYGVDLNDEATSMMQFQKSYQAACKLLTVLDSMLDTLINGTI